MSLDSSRSSSNRLATASAKSRWRRQKAALPLQISSSSANVPAAENWMASVRSLMTTSSNATSSWSHMPSWRTVTSTSDSCVNRWRLSCAVPWSFGHSLKTCLRPLKKNLVLVPATTRRCIAHRNIMRSSPLMRSKRSPMKAVTSRANTAVLMSSGDSPREMVRLWICCIVTAPVGLAFSSRSIDSHRPMRARTTCSFSSCGMGMRHTVATMGGMCAGARSPSTGYTRCASTLYSFSDLSPLFRNASKRLTRTCGPRGSGVSATAKAAARQNCASATPCLANDVMK
mmetsp:Transcript_8341/g.23486  ORF Transcript_8341/g.23486 Transcript_8341/m.23486 type:complete len:286 (-) Transcript_8341:339-1196(-)